MNEPTGFKQRLGAELALLAEDRAEPATLVTTAAAPRRRQRRWLPVVAPLTATAVAATVLVASPGHGNGHGDTAQPPAPRASVLLESAADVVSRDAAVHVGPGQYVYVRSERAAVGFDVMSALPDTSGRLHRTYANVHRKMAKPQTSQVWVPWSPKTDAVAQAGDDVPSSFPLPGPGQGLAGNMTAVSQLAALPGSPVAAYAAIKARYARYMGGPPKTSMDYLDVFDYLGGMLEESVDPRTTALLYRVAALFPGITVVPDAVDAAGRHGVAVSMEDVFHDVRVEWIFDRSTYAYLGSRSVLAHDSVVGKAGKEVAHSAVLARQVVDRAGIAPGRAGS